MCYELSGTYDLRLSICGDFTKLFYYVIFNVLKTRLVIESEKLSVHGSLVQPVVGPRSNM